VSSITHSPVTIQTSSQSVPSTPGWYGEAALIAHYLRCQSVLSAIEEQVRFDRRRFGHYEVIDFVAVLIGYAISGERTLETFYERSQPFAKAFMALFGRDRLPHRSTLSRFFASSTAFPCQVSTLATLVGSASGPQCARTLCPLRGYHPVWSAFSLCSLARSVDPLRDEHGSVGVWGLRGCLAPVQLVWQMGLVRGRVQVQNLRHSVG